MQNRRKTKQFCLEFRRLHLESVYFSSICIHFGVPSKLVVWTLRRPMGAAYTACGVGPRGCGRGYLRLWASVWQLMVGSESNEHGADMDSGPRMARQVHVSELTASHDERPCLAWGHASPAAWLWAYAPHQLLPCDQRAGGTAGRGGPSYIIFHNVTISIFHNVHSILISKYPPPARPPQTFQVPSIIIFWGESWGIPVD